MSPSDPTSDEQVDSLAGEQQIYTCSRFKLPGLDQAVEVGYRVCGTPKPDGSNVILAPTWLGASSADFEAMEYLGAGRLLDTDRYCVILLDALANGVSTSPETYADLDHFTVTIDDMVKAQHELLTAHLGFEKVMAIIGISMGGMQAFKWLELYPDYIGKISTIVSSAHIGAYDKVTWTAFIEAARALAQLPDGEKEIRRLWSVMDGFVFRSPQLVEEALSQQTAEEFYEDNRLFAIRMRVQERIAQMDAIRTFSLNLPPAKDVKTPLQFIYSPGDGAVTPFETLKMFESWDVDLVELPTPHGHLSLYSDGDLVERTVRAFLES